MRNKECWQSFVWAITSQYKTTKATSICYQNFFLFLSFSNKWIFSESLLSRYAFEIIFALENQLLKLNSIESLHMTRSVNMQTRYFYCCHDTCLPLSLPSSSDQTHIYTFWKWKKKVIVLNKQTERERERKREVVERQTTIFHTLMYSFSNSIRIQIEIIIERERNILTAVENIVWSISWYEMLEEASVILFPLFLSHTLLFNGILNIEVESATSLPTHS
jgi:hypothetical protein